MIELIGSTTQLEEKRIEMSIRDIFKPKPNKFIQLMLEQTGLTVKGLELLNTYMEKRDSSVAKKISNTEKKADEVRRILIEELMRTFVTPFDREDIFTLSREIDDILDYANTTVDEMEILGSRNNPVYAAHGQPALRGSPGDPAFGAAPANQPSYRRK
jgi:hypothetical protein